MFQKTIITFYIKKTSLQKSKIQAFHILKESTNLQKPTRFTPFQEKLKLKE